jgi:heme-degrading monooxygenase HmoA
MRGKLMFIAMNRFHVVKGCEGDFEHVWLSRDSRLENVPGIVEFELLKGPQSEDHTLYASHTIWRAGLHLKHGRDPKHFAPHISGPESASHSISDSHSLRVSMCVK